MKPKQIKLGEKVPVKLTLHERDLIREHTFYDPKFGSVAIVAENGILLRLSLEEIEDLLGYIAAEANHSTSRALEIELGQLYDKLTQLSESYEETE